MQACDSLLIQQLSGIQQKTLWIIDENIDIHCIQQIAPNDKLFVISNRFDLHKMLIERGFQASLSDYEFNHYSDFNHVIYRVSKERPLVEHCIYKAMFVLNSRGRLTLIGEKNEGIKTFAKYAQSLWENKATIEKNGTSYLVDISKTESPANDPEQTAYETEQKLSIDGLIFTTKPGVYGWKKIDQGSKLLVEAIYPELEKLSTQKLSCLDLGCGYGYLTLALGNIAFSNRYATDNNVAATSVAKKNFLDHGLTVESSLDDCAGEFNQSVDIVICNPPFHQGFSHDKNLIQRFIKTSLNLLNHNGVAYFVVNEFIPLERTVAELKAKSTLLAHENGFKVFRVNR